MKKTLNNLFLLFFNKKILAGLILFCAVLVALLYVHFERNVSAQSSGPGGSSVMSEVIGGTTMGVSDVCCNGIVLEFESVDQQNMYILDGEAIWIPGFTQVGEFSNEFSSDYNTVGKLIPGVCLEITSECESAETMPMIWTIGTGGVPAN